MSDLSAKALEIAVSQLGKEENPRGSNWGKTGDPVPGYLAIVGINFPASWCMAFMYWCVDSAVSVLVKAGTAKWINGLQSYNPLYRTGGVLQQWNLIRPEYKVQQEGATPQPGDIFIMDLGHGLGHTGMVEKVNPDGSLSTIEGNTNDTGSREGYEVARKIRHNQHPIIGYLRF